MSVESMDEVANGVSTLLNAQLGFLDTHVALIHIPLDAYPFFVKPLAQLLLHNDRVDDDGRPLEPARSWAFWHPFVNISITPGECSIVCPREQAETLFAPVVARLGSTLSSCVSISPEDYSVITIGGEGLEAGQRVLDLTSPLAAAGIPIFFITSYWSDFILVPYTARSKVIHTLEKRGFVFEADDNAGEAGLMTNPASPMLHAHVRNHSSPTSYEFPPIATTPPPTTVPELQARTFRLLKRHAIRPVVDRAIALVTCAGIKDTTASTAAHHFTQGKLQLGILRCLTSGAAPPRFLSVTLTDAESASLTLEKRLLEDFPHAGEDVLLGKDGPEQIPITLDLHALPLESTGIVCGVASRLIDGMKRRIGANMFNMSYLSTARAGHVVVYEDELDDALEFLENVQQNGSPE